MTQLRAPFFIWFGADRIPSDVDHSRSNPGPPGAAANRAGFTRVKSKQRLVLVADHTPPDAAGRVRFFYRSVNVYFALTDFAVAVSSDFAEASCAYRATRAHEIEAHIRDPIRIFYDYRDVLVARLNRETFPTADSPLDIPQANLAVTAQSFERTMVRIVGSAKRELLEGLNEARRRHDSPASYRLVYEECTDQQWATGR
jgi:hypothetical protein